MANGRNPPGSLDAADTFMGRLSSALENRLTLLIVAAAVATGGSVGINTLSPKMRADPYTGTEAGALELRLTNRIDRKRAAIDRLENRIDELERLQILDNNQRKVTENAVHRIVEMEKLISRQTQAQIDTREEMRGLRVDMRDLILRMVQQEAR